MSARAICLTRSATAGTLTLTAIGDVDAEELGVDLRALDFVATPAGIVLVAPVDEMDAAIEQLRTWGYDVVVVLAGA
ncbi:hypothetical protein [Frigoribacterium sp. UYMn621]|uniref:hypothetical protein n=1 Tax=Frigoribacterium sp. UYMn621 TaxID=3156343 RepID=UPI00339147CE